MGTDVFTKLIANEFTTNTHSFSYGGKNYNIQPYPYTVKDLYRRAYYYWVELAPPSSTNSIMDIDNVFQYHNFDTTNWL